MALYTRGDFAKHIGKKHNYISQYIKYGKIVLCKQGKRDFIDSDHPANKLFLENFFALNPIEGKELGTGEPKGKEGQKQGKRAQRGADQDLTELAPENTLLDSEIDTILEKTLTLANSTRLLKHLQAQKTQKEIQRLQLEIDKRSGEVIPYELVKHVFYRAQMLNLIALKNGLNSILISFGHEYSITTQDMARYKGEITEKLNAASMEGGESVRAQLENIVREFSQDKTQGQTL